MSSQRYQEFITERARLLERIKELEAENVGLRKRLGEPVNPVPSASNAMQNGYQRVANALSKNIRKNKAKIKYGTQVYLVNSAQKRGGSGGRKTATSNQRNSDQGTDYNTPPGLRNLRTNGGSTVPRPSLRNYGNAVGQ